MNDEKDREAMAAIAVLRRYLAERFISDDCRGNPVLGCISCAALELDLKLEGLASLIEEGDRPAAKAP